MIYFILIILVIAFVLTIYINIDRKTKTSITNKSYKIAYEELIIDEYINWLYSQFEYCKTVEEFDSLLQVRYFELKDYINYQNEIDQIRIRFKDYLLMKQN